MAGSLPFTEGSGLAETWTQKGNSASQETAKGEAAEMRLWAQDCRKASRVSGCGCDAVRDQSKTGQGPVTTTPPVPMRVEPTFTATAAESGRPALRKIRVGERTNSPG